MPENTGSGRRKNRDDGETEKKRKSCSRQNGVGRKQETKEASADLAEWIPMSPRRRGLRPSPGRAPDGARYREGLPFQDYPTAASLDFQNPGATNRNAAHPCGPRSYAYRKSVRHQNVRPRCGRPRRRAAPLPVRAATTRPPKPELCASAAQGRQFVWPWPSPIHRESISSLLLCGCSGVRCRRQSPKPNDQENKARIRLLQLRRLK